MPESPLARAAERLTVAERVARGRAARDRLARRQQGAWEPSPDRDDPVAILERQAADRVAELVPIRYGRMAASPFAFYRGAAAIMAADLAPLPVTGFDVQLCGDAHLMNFGGYAAPDRRLVFDINDFDETHPGPWEWDVKRLAASVVIATRELGFSRSDIRTATLAAVRGYRTRIRDLAERTDLATWYSRIDVNRLAEEVPGGDLRGEVKGMLADAATRDHGRLLRRLTERVDGRLQFADRPPILARVTDEESAALVRGVIAAYPESLFDDQRELMSRYVLTDIAHKVVGVGSVRLLAFVALFLGRDDDDPLFLQLKEARTSVLARHLPHPLDGHNGHRVVAGQKLMQAASDIFLGWVQGPSGRQYYVRQLTDMKWSVDLASISRRRLGLYLWLCGRHSLVPTRGPATASRSPPTSGRETWVTRRSRTSRRRTPTRTSATTVRSSRRRPGSWRIPERSRIAP